MLSKYLSLPIFLISFALGLFFVYILGPDSKTIYIYPNPQNYMNIQYKDAVDQCFEFKPIESKCPINPFSLKTVPIQE
jgi:hypothetical protein